MYRKITIEEIKAKFEESGYELLTKVYKNNRQPIKFRCKLHGVKEVEWGNFRRVDVGCSECRNQFRRKKEKGVPIGTKQIFIIDEIKEKIEKSGYELLTKTYTGKEQFIKFKCKTHGIKEVRWSNLRRLKIGCLECRKQHRKERGKKYTKVDLNEKEKKLVGKKYSRLEVLGFHSVYKDGRTLFECQCDCGKKTFASESQLFRKLKQSCGCIRKRPRKFLELNGELKSINEWSAYFGISKSTFQKYIAKGYTYQDLYYKKLNKKSYSKKLQNKDMNYILNKLKQIYPEVEKIKHRRHDLEVCGKRILIKYANANEKGRASFTYVQRQRINKEIYENETVLKNGKIKDINEQSCDYVLYLVSNGAEYNTWIIPIEDIREDAQGVSLATGRRSKFSIYEEAWDSIFIDEFEQIELTKTA
ncbi:MULTISPECIES: hypothetical protein [unclassified Bacillus cereus group]|uniref:hypothetical protein n=1 Tax=unclassified Bacillus cereus group TaxID=2750818 RepID=UPI001F55FCF8|nr:MULTISPECIES: hypothetical protein [unclassified Bacillus cereus group]MDX5808507.1 hypothetical protein [Bacillus cereus group sp. BfR-BA-02730]